jgi:hypothetical protein
MIGRAEGTVRIVHESGSSIVMDENGNIQIQCGADGQIRIGATDASSQRVIKGDDLVDAINKFADGLNAALALGGNLGAPLTGQGGISSACETFKTESLAALSAIVQTE